MSETIVEESNSKAEKSNLLLNIEEDIYEEVGRILSKYGLSLPTLDELGEQDKRDKLLISKIKDYDLELILTHFFTVLKRVIPLRKWKVEFSREFNLINRRCAIEEIRKKFIAGENLNSLHSKKLLKRNQRKNNDLLLYEWRIHHLHLSESGTNDLLMVFLLDGTAYFLDVLQHENKNVGNETWTNPRFIQIIHDNWPRSVEHFRYLGGSSESNLVFEERRALRKKHCNKFISVSDGTTYMPFGGGFMSSGHPMDAVIFTDRFIDKVRWLREAVELNISEIRRVLKLDPDKELSLQLKIDDEKLEPFWVECASAKMLNFVAPKSGQ